MPLTNCYYDNEIKEDEMGRTRGTHGARRGVGRVLVGKLKERNRMEDLSM